MRVYRANYNDRSGKAKKSQCWYLDFRDHHARRHKLRGFTAKRPTEALGRNIEALINCRLSGDSIPVSLQSWIDGLNDRLASKLVKWDLLTGQRASQVKLLKSHLFDYEQELRHKNKSHVHIQKTISRCTAIRKACGLNYLRDIEASKVIAYLAEMRQGGATAGTRNHFLTAMKCFLNWCIKTGRISKNPLAHVTKEKNEPKQRGILLPEQFQKLISETFEQGAIRLNVPAPERCLLYVLVGGTGLRKKEIVALKWKYLKLSDKESCVILPGTKTKNKKEAKQPLPPQVATVFSSYRKQTGVSDDERVFPNVKYRINTAELVREDLKAAELDLTDFAGREIDFHSLRNSFISFLANSDTPFKAVQALARHSDPKLTFNTYARIFQDTEKKAVSSLPTIDVTSQAMRSIMSGNFSFEKAGEKDEICLSRSLSFLGGQAKDKLGETGLSEGDRDISENSQKAAILAEKQGLEGTAGGGTRTLTLLPKRDFESRASANSATPAR